MIQAGNLKTRGLSREKSLPGDSDEATIKAETMPEKFVHVRGYIGAAREGDDTNPEKKSSFSQFYIVTGKYYTDMDLDEMELVARGSTRPSSVKPTSSRAVQRIWMADTPSLVACSMAGVPWIRSSASRRMTTTAR